MGPVVLRCASPDRPHPRNELWAHRQGRRRGRNRRAPIGNGGTHPYAGDTSPGGPWCGRARSERPRQTRTRHGPVEVSSTDPPSETGRTDTMKPPKA